MWRLTLHIPMATSPRDYFYLESLGTLWLCDHTVKAKFNILPHIKWLILVQALCTQQAKGLLLYLFKIPKAVKQKWWNYLRSSKVMTFDDWTLCVELLLDEWWSLDDDLDLFFEECSVCLPSDLERERERDLESDCSDSDSSELCLFLDLCTKYKYQRVN